MSILIKHGGQAPSSHRKRVWHFGLMIWPPNKSSSPIGCPGKSECKAARDWLKHFLSDYLCEALVSKSHPVHRKRQAKLGLLQQEKLRKGGPRRTFLTPWLDFPARTNQCSQTGLFPQSLRPGCHWEQRFWSELLGLTLLCPHRSGLLLAGRQRVSYNSSAPWFFPGGGWCSGEGAPGKQPEGQRKGA